MLNSHKHKKPEPVTVLDIGSSKVICLIGIKDANMGARLLGAGFGVSAGMKAGAVVDLEAIESGIRTAVTKAERAAGVAVRNVHVNIATRSVRSEQLSIKTDFASDEVAERDMKRLLQTSMAEYSGLDHSIVHAIPLSWRVDGETKIEDPRGMYGSSLGVDMHFVLAGLGPLRNLAHSIERCHLTMSSVTVSPYAAGLSVLTDDEKDLGVTLIDLGGGITSTAVFRDNRLIHVDVLSVGGHTLTKDIARGLMTPPEAAERIKMLYGSALHGADDDSMIVPCPPMGAQDVLHHEQKSVLTEIVRSRTEETLEIIQDRLSDLGLDHYAGRRIVLTGGGARLNGVRELTELIFNKRVRIGRPHGVLGLKEEMSGPDFAVATGLLKKRLMPNMEAIHGPPDLTGRRYRQKRYTGNTLGRSMQWLKENF